MREVAWWYWTPAQLRGRYQCEIIRIPPQMFTARAVLKINPGQIPEMGWDCSHARSQQSPNVRGTRGRAQQAAEYLRDGVYFPLLLKEKMYLASCCFTISQKDASLLPAQQDAAKHLHLHFMVEGREDTDLLEVTPGCWQRAVWPMFSLLDHIAWMSCHLKFFHSQSCAKWSQEVGWSI